MSARVPAYIRSLPSGYVHVRFHTFLWAQFDPASVGDELPADAVGGDAIREYGVVADVQEWWRAGGRAQVAREVQP